MSFLHSNSFDAFKICYSQALQTGWHLRNANCGSRNIWCTGSSSLMQHQHGVWLSACSVQVYQLQSLLVETYGNRCGICEADSIINDAIFIGATGCWIAKSLLLVESKNFAVTYIDMKTWLELNSTCLWQASDIYFFTEDQFNS